MAGIEPLSRHDIDSLFAESDIGSTDLAAVWQRRCDAICQHLAISQVDIDINLVVGLWSFADGIAKLKVIALLLNS